MNEPQIWTMIGVFSALMLGMLTIVSTLFVRVVRAEIGGLRHELLGEIRGEVGTLRGEMGREFGSIRGELQSLNSKVDGLDRDVQLLMNREFGKERD
ncbi:MAG TPA: hypothetical protein PK781_01855 [Terrimesophilobacter sp.]|nr:hypothetical protein [Terrimesophilobacter sp.]